jgi:hypothetical protein
MRDWHAIDVTRFHFGTFPTLLPRLSFSQNSHAPTILGEKCAVKALDFSE